MHIGSTWTFHLQSSKSVVNIYEAKDLCSHSIPNSLQLFTREKTINFDSESSLQVKILDESRVDSDLGPGTWNILYDQALVVEIGSQRFIANLRHNMKQFL